MRELRVMLPARNKAEARVVGIAFTHPWQKLTHRGTTGIFRVTTCTIGKVLQEAADGAKVKIRPYAFAKVKWPLQTYEIDGKVMRDKTWVATHEINQTVKDYLQWVREKLPSGVTLKLSKQPKLSKTQACKQALRKALDSINDTDRFTYEERKQIWLAFHKEFRTGVVQDPGPTPTVTPGSTPLPAMPSDVPVTLFGVAVKDNPSALLLAHHLWPDSQTIH